MAGAKTADATPNTGNRSLDRPRIVASRDCCHERKDNRLLESVFVFYPRYVRESPTRLGDIGLYRKARKILKEVPVAPDRWTYSDLALPGNDENDRLDIYHATAGGEGGARPQTPRRHAASGPGQSSFRRGRGLSICRSDPPAISLDFGEESS